MSVADDDVIKEILCLFRSDFDFLDSIPTWLSTNSCGNHGNSNCQQNSSHSLASNEEDERKTLSWLQASSLNSFSSISSTVNEFQLISELKSYNVIPRAAYDTRTFTKIKRTHLPITNLLNNNGIRATFSKSSLSSSPNRSSLLTKFEKLKLNPNVKPEHDIFDEIIDVGESDSFILTNNKSFSANNDGVDNIQKNGVMGKKVLSPVKEQKPEISPKTAEIYDCVKYDEEDDDDFENNEKQSYQDLNQSSKQLINGCHNETVIISDNKRNDLRNNNCHDNDRNYNDVQEIARKQEETLSSNSPIHPIPNPSLFISNQNKSFSTNDVHSMEFDSPIDVNSANITKDIPLISTPHLGIKSTARNLPYANAQTLHFNQQKHQQLLLQQQQLKDIQQIQPRVMQKPQLQFKSQLQHQPPRQGQIIPTITNLRPYKNEQETVGRSLPNLTRKLNKMSFVGTQKIIPSASTTTTATMNSTYTEKRNDNYFNYANNNTDLNSTFSMAKGKPLNNKAQTSYQVPLPVKVQTSTNNNNNISYTINQNQNNKNISNRNGGQVNLNRTATFKVTKPVHSNYDNNFNSDENIERIKNDYENDNVINGGGGVVDQDYESKDLRDVTFSLNNCTSNSKTGPLQSVTNIRAISGLTQLENKSVLPQTKAANQQQHQQQQQQQQKLSKIPGPKSVRSAIPVSGVRNSALPVLLNSKAIPSSAVTTKVHLYQQEQVQLQGHLHTGQYQRTQRVPQADDFGEPRECNEKSWRNGCY